MTKVSIIIPVYNSEKHLSRCLDSLCSQSLSDIEMVCVNDCSSDSSLSILSEYSNKDNRVKIIDFKENQGCSKARNEGIKSAVGEYIGFCDSDDYIDSDFYEKLYEKANQTNADVVKAQMASVDNNTKEVSYSCMNEKILENKMNFFGEFYTAIYKKEFIKAHNILFPENISTFEDPMFNILVLKNTDKIELVENTYYNYVVYDNSKCRDYSIQKLKVRFDSANLMLDEISDEDDYKIVLDCIIDVFYGQMKFSSEQDSKDFITQGIKELLQLHPEFSIERDFEKDRKARYLKYMKNIAKSIRSKNSLIK